MLLEANSLTTHQITFSKTRSLQTEPVLLTQRKIRPETPTVDDRAECGSSSFTVERVTAFTIEFRHQTNQHRDVFSICSAHFPHHLTDIMAAGARVAESGEKVVRVVKVGGVGAFLGTGY